MQKFIPSQTLEEVCRMKPDPGSCYAIFPAWYFNSDSGRCEEFTYGGCGGNENRFDTETACAEKCIVAKVVQLEDSESFMWPDVEPEKPELSELICFLIDITL